MAQLRNLRLLGRAAALSLAAALAPWAAAEAQTAPRHHITIDNETFGFARNRGGPTPVHSTRDYEGFGFVPPMQITILTRNGAPVTTADIPAATNAARAICQGERLEFDRHARGRLLRRGGILFSGYCG